MRALVETARIWAMAGGILGDGTRLIFWLDMLILVAVTFLVLAGQWDFVIALFISLVFLNYFDRWRNRGE